MSHASPPAPAPQGRDQTLGFLVAGLAGAYVLSLLSVQLMGAAHLEYGSPGALIIDTLVSLLHYGLLVLIALRIPQPALRILAITVFAIFFLDGVLGRLGVFSLFSPWFSSAGPFEYFQF